MCCARLLSLRYNCQRNGEQRARRFSAVREYVSPTLEFCKYWMPNITEVCHLVVRRYQ